MTHKKNNTTRTASTAQSLLRVSLPTCGYGRDILLHDVQIDCPHNGIVWLYGPSGSGKTTLLKIMGCLTRPSMSGIVTYDGEDIYQRNAAQRARYRNEIAWFSFQDYNLLSWLSVLDNIMLPATIGGQTIDRERRDELIETLRISHLLTKRVATLSGGEIERVSLIKAIAHKPRVLLCDEPWSSLHNELKTIVYDLLASYCEERLGVIVSHDHDFRSYTSVIYDTEEFAP